MKFLQTYTGDIFMAQNSKFLLLTQIREIYERVVFTHKVHEKCADRYTNTNRIFRLTQLILLALISSGLIAIILTEQLWIEIITAVISFILLCVNSYLKDFNPASEAEKQNIAAKDVLNLREKYFSLIRDIMAEEWSIPELITRRDTLQKELMSTYRNLPRTTSKDYTEARRALFEDDEFSCKEDEINALLPDAFKINVSVNSHP